MRQIISRRTIVAVAATAPLALGPAWGAAKPRKPDLADAVAGAYAGDVISDSAGSGKSDVTLTLARVGPNRVSIGSDYPRLPVLTVQLERAMDRIVNAGEGDTSFVFVPETGRLDVSFHNEVSWSGSRR